MIRTTIILLLFLLPLLSFAQNAEAGLQVPKEPKAASIKAGVFTGIPAISIEDVMPAGFLVGANFQVEQEGFLVLGRVGYYLFQTGFITENYWEGAGGIGTRVNDITVFYVMGSYFANQDGRDGRFGLSTGLSVQVPISNYLEVHVNGNVGFTTDFFWTSGTVGFMYTVFPWNKKTLPKKKVF